jgi:hypothetical protein
MSTFIQILAPHMRFVPAHKQLDEATTDLSPAKWPIEQVLISNEKGCEVYLCHYRIRVILSPTIQATCCLTLAQTNFFPIPPTPGSAFGQCPTTHPLRPLPIFPATPGPTTPRGPDTPPRGRFTDATSRVQPNLGNIMRFTLPTSPLKIVELSGGLVTGLETYLKAGYAVALSAWADTNPDAHAVVPHCLSRVRSHYPQILPMERGHTWLGLPSTHGRPHYLPRCLQECHPRVGVCCPFQCWHNTSQRLTKGEFPQNRVPYIG